MFEGVVRKEREGHGIKETWTKLMKGFSCI